MLTFNDTNLTFLLVLPLRRRHRMQPLLSPTLQSTDNPKTCNTPMGQTPVRVHVTKALHVDSDTCYFSLKILGKNVWKQHIYKIFDMAILTAFSFCKCFFRSAYVFAGAST